MLRDFISSVFFLMVLVGMLLPTAQANLGGGECQLQLASGSTSVGSTFTVDVYITTYSWSLGSFKILIQFEQTQMTLLSRMITVPSGKSWSVGSGHDTIGSDTYDLWMYNPLEDGGNNVPGGTNKWVTLTFQCIAEGTSTIVFKKSDLWYGYSAQSFGDSPITPVTTIELTCNQRARLVGGIITPTNTLLILGPYLTLVGLVTAVATATVVMKRRSLSNKRALSQCI